jgi:spoIIIJ-associated protein
MATSIREEGSSHAAFEGSTTEEALERALQALGLRPEEADVEVVDRGARGFLGIGTRPARVRVAWKIRAAGRAQEAVESILSKMGIAATVRATQAGREVRVEISSGESDGLLIGRKGETLAALQHLVGRIVGKQFPDPTLVVVIDVAGYRGRREEHLRQHAAQLADRVRRSGKRGMTEPLSPSERRTVHHALLAEPGIQSHTAGDGANRRVIVTPSRKKPAEG